MLLTMFWLPLFWLYLDPYPSPTRFSVNGPTVFKGKEVFAILEWDRPDLPSDVNKVVSIVFNLM